MDNDQPAVARGRGSTKKTTGNTRRTWSKREEQVLIVALKDLVSNGWKSDNGFRTGYLNKLEDALKKAFPQTDLQKEPNITSKLTTWKKLYGSLVSAQRETTGVGFNTTTNTLEVTDELWDSVVKKDHNMRGMRHKEWPLFPDWIEIFGKDRATGEVAEDVPDAAATTMKNRNQNTQNTPSETEFNGDNYFNLDGTTGKSPETSHVNEEQGENSTAHTNVGVEPSRKTGKKRKSNTESNDPSMSELLRDLCRSTGDRLDTIAQRIGHDHDMIEKRTKVFDLLGTVPGLSTVQKLDISEIIGSKIECLDLFISLPEDARAVYAHHILERASA